jgi:hypothetical protein
MLTAVLVVALGVPTALARAQTLTFEGSWWGGTSQPTELAPGYSGFTWKNFWVVDRAYWTSVGQTNANGFDRLAAQTNSQVVAFNQFGSNATMERAQPFDFVSAVVASGQRQDMTLTILGFDSKGVKLYTESYQTGQTPRTITPNWTGVSKVEFDSGDNGTIVVQPGSKAFAIDNIVLTQVIPEPSTVLLLGAGLVGLFAGARRR